MVLIAGKGRLARPYRCPDCIRHPEVPATRVPALPALLESLLRHAGQVLSRTQILFAVWEYEADPSSNVVDVYIGYLRRKLGSQAIATVRGVGYRFDGA